MKEKPDEEGAAIPGMLEIERVPSDEESHQVSLRTASLLS
jgi:hypothetical protein